MKKLYLLLFVAFTIEFFLGYFLGYKDGSKPDLKRGVWVLIQTTPYGGYRVAAITNANEVFTTNLNIQGWTK